MMRQYQATAQGHHRNRRTNMAKNAAKPAKRPARATRTTMSDPKTISDWLMEQFDPDNPEFPLDPEIIASIPDDLEGEIPTNAREYIAGLSDDGDDE
jgi:hypothetical protein